MIGDKLPIIPSRIAPGPLFARVVSGGLGGACLFVAAGTSLVIGAALGGVGGLVGAFAGYEIRRRLVTNLRCKDFVVALGEDVIAIAMALLLVTR